MLQQTFMDSFENRNSRIKSKLKKRANENHKIENYKIKIKVSVCSELSGNGRG